MWAKSATVTSDNGHWTYYSIEEGKTVGTSVFGDSIADREWAARKDWDIAISGDLLRTNGGASGSGEGAIQMVSGDYDALNDAPKAGYVKDVYE